MSLEDDLWEQERHLWMGGRDAMVSEIADGAVIVVPFAGILQGDAITESLEGTPDWADVTFSERTCTRKDGAVVLAYKALAHRDDDSRYEGWCASTYIRDGDRWRMLSHQQTPVEDAG